ncbi:MAG: 50S ribosomal protein L19 [Kiritimatiellae bacterium]|nr:50S ribosomal protein L19 [Kiritimatiellia bacterium]MDD4735496.1 50S ribosomal protein L19 [Kiritimatiellia bacterium]
MSVVLDKIDQEQRRKEEQTKFAVGDTVSVHVKIREGEKERIQLYKGTVIAIKGKGATEMFTVRRISYGEGVERIFPMHSPNVVKVDVERAGKVRRAKLYYLRELSGKKSRIKERRT